MIYLDSSALLKLIRREDETEALRGWLELRPELPAVTSELGRVEVVRVASRFGDHALARARAVIGDLDLVPLDRAVQDLACEVGDPPLRTLDALHLASALVLGDGLTGLITYDRRLADAARTAGLVVTTPGEHSPDAG